MPDIAYQNKDITSKILGEKLKNKSFSVYGVKVPKIIRVLPTNLPAIQANELRIDNLFLLEDGSLALVDYESDYKHEDKIKYLDYIARTIKRCMEEEDAQIAYPLKIRMIVIYTADIEPRQTCSVLDVGCLRVQVEEAFLKQINSRETETHLKNRIDEGKALSDEEQMQLIILPLTYPGREEKQECIRRCFEMVKKVGDESVQSFILSGMLVFSDKVIARDDSKKIKEWLMLTKVGQLFEEEKLEYAQKLVEEEKEHTVVKMLKKGFPVSEILELIDGITEADVELIQKNIK